MKGYLVKDKFTSCHRSRDRSWQGASERLSDEVREIVLDNDSQIEWCSTIVFIRVLVDIIKSAMCLTWWSFNCHLVCDIWDTRKSSSLVVWRYISLCCVRLFEVETSINTKIWSRTVEFDFSQKNLIDNFDISSQSKICRRTYWTCPGHMMIQTLFPLTLLEDSNTSVTLHPSNEMTWTLPI